MRTPLLTAVALCLLSAAVLAQGTFPLEYREGKSADVPALAMASRSFSQTAEKPAEITGLPADLRGDAIYFRGVIAGKPLWAVACGGSPVRLYLDTDGDNNLSDEKALSATAADTGVSFGMVSLPLAEKGTVAVRAFSHSGADGKTPQCLHLEASGYRTGEVRLADKTYRVALIDNNLNGRCDDALSGPFGSGAAAADALVIDLNGDGSFEAMRNYNQPGEWAPLSKACQVGGAYYRVEVPADGGQIRFEKTEPTFGTVDLGPGRVEMTAFSDFGFQKVEAADGKARLPAGLYAPVSLTVTHTDTEGGTWEFTWNRNDERLGTFKVAAGETTAIPLGPPLVAEADVRQAERNVRVNFRLVGRSGEQYSAMVTRNGAQRQPPSVEIVDKAGKVLASGKMAYG
ncbi:MAG: hypothetical protein IMZ66_03785 [Planctomycetes bacterium]|nr:hypothetical protein [Planctomycetota bacterium]